MNFMTVLTYVMAIVETGALIGGLVFVTKAIKEKKNSDARRSHYMQGGIYLVVYLVLNLIRNFFL